MALYKKIIDNYQSYILVLLIISGPVKSLFNYFISSFNITLFVFFVASVDIAFALVKKKTYKSNALFSLTILVSLFMLMTISLFYTTSLVYSKEKTLKFLLVIFCFIYPFFVKSFNWRVFLKITYLFVIPLSILFIYYRHFYWSATNSLNRSYEVGSFHDSLGSYLGLGYVLVLATFVLVERKKWIIFFLVILLLLALGARGPLIFCLLTILIVHFKSILNKTLNFRVNVRKTIMFFIVSFLSTILVVVKFNFIKENIYKLGFDRFVSLFSSTREDASANERIKLMSFAFKEIFTDPIIFLFGRGIGSFGIEYFGKDIKENPHNIFLETWFELGILGFILITLFLLFPFIFKRNTLYLSFVIFALLECLKSNNLAGIWILALIYSVYLNDLKSTHI